MDDEYISGEDDGCWQCGGEGYVIWGCDIDIHDPFWDPAEGEVTKCPCCRGTGELKDCLYF